MIQTRYARAELSTPFAMGGSGRRDVRYALAAVDFHLLGFALFWHERDGVVRIHERTCGMLLCEESAWLIENEPPDRRMAKLMATFECALSTAKGLVGEDPARFAAEIAEAGDVMRLPEESAERMLPRLRRAEARGLPHAYL